MDRADREEIARLVADAIARHVAAPPRLALSPSEAADALGCDRSTVYRWLNRGELAAARVGGRLFIRVSALDDFLREHEPGDEYGRRSGAA